MYQSVDIRIHCFTILGFSSVLAVITVVLLVELVIEVAY